MLAGVGEQGIEAMKRATLLGKVAEPEELAATVVGMVCPKISGYTTGQIVAANGGMYMA
jgi:NAD(P)-dependent dehydrogenase (short-subunit alcohol dehydrogenase family)